MTGIYIIKNAIWSGGGDGHWVEMKDLGGKNENTGQEKIASKLGRRL